MPHTIQLSPFPSEDVDSKPSPISSSPSAPKPWSSGLVPSDMAYCESRLKRPETNVADEEERSRPAWWAAACKAERGESGAPPTTERTIGSQIRMIDAYIDNRKVSFEADKQALADEISP